jgi:hypothetical protein
MQKAIPYYLAWSLVAMAHLGWAQSEPKLAGWAVGVDLGMAQVDGDVRAAWPGGGINLWGQKAILPMLDLRLCFWAGQALGQDLQPQRNVRFNAALNRRRDSVLFYPNEAQVYHNFRLRALASRLRFQCNLSPLWQPHARWNPYLHGGLGLLLSLTQIDAIDETRAEIYDYGSIDGAEGSRSLRQSLQDLRDGTYETPAESEVGGRADPNAYVFNLAFELGLGISCRLQEKWALYLDLGYLLSGSDLLDGQQWLPDNQPSAENDHLLLLSLGLMRRL